MLVDIVPLYRFSHPLFCRVHMLFFLALCIYTKKSATKACNSKEFPSSCDMRGVCYIFGQGKMRITSRVRSPPDASGRWDTTSTPGIGYKMVISDEGHGKSPDDDIPRMIVARPRAVPIPLPLIAFTPVRLNLCKCKWWSVRVKCKIGVAGGRD